MAMLPASSNTLGDYDRDLIDQLEYLTRLIDIIDRSIDQDLQRGMAHNTEMRRRLKTVAIEKRENMFARIATDVFGIKNGGN